MSKCFRYSIEFGSFVNPTQVLERLRGDLITYLESEGCEPLSNSLMNSVARSTGVVVRNHSSLDEGDRDKFAHWLGKQNIQCRVTLGQLEELEGLDLMSDFAGDEFVVENLTSNQLADGEKQRAEIQARIDAIQNNGPPT